MFKFKIENHLTLHKTAVKTNKIRKVSIAVQLNNEFLKCE